MGLCSSCKSRHVATTAKLILHDGTLQEYPYPVKASCVLQKHPAVFICNSDEMDFNDVVRAVRGDHVLQSGQLYFALPLSRLHRPLQPHEMAALAVKASSALVNATDRCRKQLTFSGDREVMCPRRRGRVSSGKGEKFTAMLSAIAE